MIDINNFEEIGIIRKVYGVHGDINIEIQNKQISFKDNIEFLFIEIDGGLVPFSVIDIEIRNSAAIAEFGEIKSKNEAEKYVGLKIFISKKDINFVDKANNTSMAIYIGYMISDIKHGNLAIINNLIEYPNNPQFEIIIDDIAVMIPATIDLIETIDNENKIIKMNLPEGLIDIYLEDE
ncbi:MAG: hypothetical protein U9R19_05295 [Bacteroidota bacterium]|nr:hypothetical protein [Bacteroidota bacterium]